MSRGRFAHPVVHVVHRAFVPRRLRIAKPRFGSHAIAQLTPGRELKTAIKGDAAPRICGQGRHLVDPFIHQRSRLAIVVAQQDGVAGLSFYRCRDIGVALRAFKNHQVTLPITKLAAAVDLIRCLFPMKKLGHAPCGRSEVYASFAARAGTGQVPEPDRFHNRHTDRSSVGKSGTAYAEPLEYPS